MGLYDREYMRDNNQQNKNNGNAFFDNPMSMIWVLIGINVFFFISFPANSTGWARLVLTPDFLDNFQIYRLLTAGFMHAGFGHIFFNMWGLYIFGSLVAPHIGSYKFLALYIVGVISGNLLFLAFNSEAYLLGASGAVCAVMMNAAMLEPNRKFSFILFPFMPIKTSTLVVVYTLLEIFSEITGSQGGVAHLAHLGGFIGGYIFLKILYNKKFLPWDPFRKKQNTTINSSNVKWNFKTPTSENVSDKVSQKELDYLLDKVSRDGINSLSEQEIARLRQARREMRGE